MDPNEQKLLELLQAQPELPLPQSIIGRPACACELEAIEKGIDPEDIETCDECPYPPRSA